MILRETRIVTALYDGFSSILAVTTLAAPTADVNPTSDHPGNGDGNVVLWEAVGE
jgi:hypothetical protein